MNVRDSSRNKRLGDSTHCAHTWSANAINGGLSLCDWVDDQGFRAILKNTRKIEIVQWSAPKQTETTQRWKVAIQIGSQLPIPTKIEFSRREPEIVGAEVKQVSAQLTSGYQLQPVLLQHYILPKAIEQKIGALVNRTETQVRDVVDLHLLKSQISDPKKVKLSLSSEQKEKALETLMSVSFDDFKSQVWPYLLREYQGHYDSKDNWDQVQAEVIKFFTDRSEAK